MIRITANARDVHARAANHFDDEVAKRILGNRAQPDGRPAEPGHGDREVGVGAGDADTQLAGCAQRPGIGWMQQNHGLAQGEDMAGWTAHGRKATMRL